MYFFNMKVHVNILPEHLYRQGVRLWSIVQLDSCVFFCFLVLLYRNSTKTYKKSANLA